MKKSILSAFSKFSITKSSIAVIAMMLVFGLSGLFAHASMVPTLTLTGNGNGTIQAIVAGDPDASIQMYYVPSSGSASVSEGVIGSTAQNGYLSTVLYTYANSTSGIYNYNFYNIPYNAQVFVVVDGLQSSSVFWPYAGIAGVCNGGIGAIPVVGTIGNCTPGTLSLSQTNLNLTLGQSSVVSVYNSSNYNYSTTYPLVLSGNTNPSVAAISAISGSTFTITGQSYGSTVLTICANANAFVGSYQNQSVCGTVYVTVSASGIVTSPVSSGSIYFNVSTVNLNAGQSQSVQIYQNQNGYNGTYNNGYYSGAYGSYGTYYISSNSNPSVATANVSGSSLNIYASAPGNDTVIVCSNVSVCASLYVTVNYVNGYTGAYQNYQNYQTYQSYPSYPVTYLNPVTPSYVPATVYSNSSYMYPYSYSTPVYYSEPTYYPY